jgi:hypothetical protein
VRAYLRYMPNLVRDEWVNIGVLVFDPYTGERRLRMIEEPEEYARVQRLHPQGDEGLPRALRDDLENRFASATEFLGGNGHSEGNARTDWYTPTMWRRNGAQRAWERPAPAV